MDDEVIAPPYVIKDNDKRGLVVVIAVTTLSFCWTCLLIRLWLRWKLREWKVDDYLLVAATITDTALGGIVFNVVSDGLGKSQGDLSLKELRRIGKDDFAIQILYIVTLLLSKCGVLLLYLRLSPRKGHTYAAFGILSLSVIWATASFALIAATPCNASHYWPHGVERCSKIGSRWRAITALDIITEASIFLISIYLVARLNMKTKTKYLVVAAFSIRLPVIAAAATRLHYLEAMLSSNNMTLIGAYYIVCTQSQLGYAIISSTLTGLGPFLRPFSQSPSTVPGSGLPSSALSKSRQSTHADSGYAEDTVVSYQMKPIQRLNRPQRPIRPDSNNVILRPQRDLVKQDTAVLGRGDAELEDAASRLSDDSQRMIITKKTEFTVDMDQASASTRREWSRQVGEDSSIGVCAGHNDGGSGYERTLIDQQN